MAAGLGAAAYLNTLHNPFVYDDQAEIIGNVSLRDVRHLWTILQAYPTRPLTNLSYAIDYAFSGLDPFNYHLTSVVLHLLNVVLLFRLARGFLQDGEERSTWHPAGGSHTGAFTAAALFAVHPMMTEAVGYVSGRAEVLCATFFLGSMCAFRQALHVRRARYTIAGLLLWGFALASKETAAVLPLILLAYDRLAGVGTNEERKRRLWRMHGPLILVVFLLGAVRIAVYLMLEQQGAAAASWKNSFIELYAFGRYLGMLALPYGQTIVHPTPPIGTIFDRRVWVACGLVLLLIRGAFLVRRQLPAVTIGTIWFFLVLVPSAMLVLLADRGQPMAEHRTYLASCGMFIAIGSIAQRVPRFETGGRRRLVWLVTGLGTTLAILFGLTVMRNQVWSDPVLLWQDAARKAPRIWIAHFGLANAHLAKGDYLSASGSYERAIAILPNDLEPYGPLANTWIQLNRFDKAAAVLQEAVRRSPRDAQWRLALAEVQERGLNDPAEAFRLCREALALTPSPEAQSCVQRNQARLSTRALSD